MTPSPARTSQNHAATLECFNPATGEKLDELAVATSEDVVAALARARDAFQLWKEYRPKDRAEILLRARDLIMERSEQIVELLMAEAGKSRFDCYPDLFPLSESIEFYAKNAERFLADRPLRTRALAYKRTRSWLRPRGVVVTLSSYCYPIETAWGPAIPALLAGNVVINKPSEHTPLCALRIRDILIEAGVPKGAVQVLVGGPEVGAQLCRDVDFVAFTGTSAVGRKVAAQCLEQLIPYSLAHGGKDPALVLEDANIDRAVHGAVWGAFYNSGQTCVSTERCYVHESVYDQFLAKAIELTKRLRQGPDNTRFELEVGAMITEDRVAFIEGQVAEAREMGAVVQTGGQRNAAFPDGNFYEPTILTDVTHDMRVMTEETCGPVLPVMKVASDDEAIRWANQCDYGLNSSVFSGSTERALRIADRLEVGACNINECMVQYAAPELPFGGVKHSGLGKRKGAGAMARFCHQKTVLEDIIGAKREFVWYPYSRMAGEVMHRMTTAMYSRGLKGRISAILGKR